MIAHLCRTAHSFCHLSVAADALETQGDGLNLGAHGIELGDVASCPDEVLGHDFACVLLVWILVTRLGDLKLRADHLAIAS